MAKVEKEVVDLRHPNAAGALWEANTVAKVSRIKFDLRPNKAGYSVMEPFILSAVDKVLE